MGKRDTAVYSLEGRAIATLRRQFGQEVRNWSFQADEKSRLWV